jgi:hypothetical protein
MNASSRPLIRYTVGGLAALSMMLAATLQFCWRGLSRRTQANLIPDDSSREGSILCQQGQDTTRCARRHSLIW